jgi:hypothetical protein
MSTTCGVDSVPLNALRNRTVWHSHLTGIRAWLRLGGAACKGGNASQRVFPFSRGAERSGLLFGPWRSGVTAPFGLAVAGSWARQRAGDWNSGAAGGMRTQPRGHEVVCVVDGDETPGQQRSGTFLHRGVAPRLGVAAAVGRRRVVPIDEQPIL